MKEDEKEILKFPQDLKPFISDVGETQFSHILSQLCRGHERCAAFYIYQKDGILMGAGEVNPPQIESIFLPDPLKKLGVQKLTSDNQKAPVGAWAIYRKEISPQVFTSQLSLKALDGEKLVGFLCYYPAQSIPQVQLQDDIALNKHFFMLSSVPLLRISSDKTPGIRTL
jgi:hypothetical protein